MSEARMEAGQLGRFMEAVLGRLGVPEADARVCAEVLLAADLRGIDSHGVSRLKPIYVTRLRQGVQQAVTQVEVLREGPTTAVLDGHHGMGMVIAKQAMELAIAKAKKFGMGMVVVKNSTHFGIAGYYAGLAAQAGMVGMCGSNARPAIAPTFGTQPMLGTNPLTFGIPTDEDFPFMLDCATSIAQRGKVELYARKGRPLPECWVVDEEGHCRTDAAGVLADLGAGRAALLPLGGAGEKGAGYKGYGYATVVELLSAAFTQGAFLWGLLGLEDGKPAPNRLGHFFLAMDVAAFTELDAFKATAGAILRELRGSRRAPGQPHIYTAGEKEYQEMQRRLEAGVPLLPSVQQELEELRQELALDFAFPWDRG